MGGGRPPGPTGRTPGAGVVAEGPRNRGTTHPRPVGAHRTPPPAEPTLVGWPRQVTWSEFREVNVAPDGAAESAQIDSNLQMPSEHRIVTDQGQLRLSGFRATLSVKRSDSWVVKSQKSATLLAHEQGH